MFSQLAITLVSILLPNIMSSSLYPAQFSSKMAALLVIFSFNLHGIC